MSFKSPQDPHYYQSVPVQTVIWELVEQRGYSFKTVILFAVHQLLSRFGNGSHTVIGLVEQSKCLKATCNSNVWDIAPSVFHHGESQTVKEALDNFECRQGLEPSDEDCRAESIHGIPSGLCDMVVILAGDGTESMYIDVPCYIAVHQQKKTVKLSMHFAVSRFVKETMIRFADALQQLLEIARTGAEAHIDEVEILSPADLKQLQAWNNTDGEYPSCKRLHHLIEETVQKCGGQTAIVCDGRHLSYHDLNVQANRLARYLCSRDVQPEHLIALFVDKSELLIVIILAIWKSGAAYTAIDPAYPDERARFVLEDTETRVVITSERHVQRLEQDILPTGGIFTVMAVEPMLEQLPYNVPPNASSNLDHLALTSRQLAYITYTSGTTGQPKGIFKEQTSVVNSITDLSVRYGVANRKDETILLFSAYVFEPFVRQMLMALVTGARLAIIGDEDKYDPTRLISFIKEQHVTYLHGTASVLQEFDFSTCSSIRRVILVGESLTDARYHALRRQFPQAILSEYGFTESAFVTALNVLEPGAPGPSGSLGRPVRNVKCYILNRALCQVPIGVTGELHVGGLGISRGYLNRPELTEQRFLPNPFQTHDERRRGVNGLLYKTGDLACWLSSGAIQYLGRADFQIKLRGIRIEPGEIESTMSKFPGVRASLVVCRRLKSGPDGTHETKQDHLVGYYVSERPGIFEAELLSFVEKILPRYMIPSRLVELPQIPTTINGKADLRALPVPSLHSFNGVATDAIFDGTESLLCRIWADVLGIEETHITPEDSFFRLGGHSITCIQLMARIREQTNIRISIEDVFAKRTLNSMAQLVRERQRVLSQNGVDPEEPALPVLSPNLPSDDTLEAWILANSLQQGFVYHYLKTHGDSQAYVMQSVIRYDTEIDATRYYQAWKDTQAAFPALRLRFAWKEEVFQLVDREQPLDWRLRESMAKETREEDRILDELQDHDRQEPYKLEEGQLFRVYLIQNPETNRSRCLFSCHHAVMDGWSLPLLFEHVHEAYLSEPPAFELTPWMDTAYLESQRFLQAHRHDHRSHWAGVLDPVTERCDLNPLLNEASRYEVPLAEYDDIQDQRQKTLVVDRSQWLSQLREECAADGITLHSLLQFIWHRVLSTYGGGSQTITGTTIAGRQLPIAGIEDSVGMYINTLPLVLDHKSTESQTVRQAVIEVQKRVNEMNSRGAVELGHIGNSRLKHGLFDTLFVLENYPTRDHSRAQRHREALQCEICGGIEKLDYPLAVIARESSPEATYDSTDDSFSITLCYAGELFADETIDKLLASVQDILHQVSRHLDHPVQSLEHLSSDQADQLSAWNNTQADFPWATLHELFSFEARRQPNKAAVVTETVSLTYAELNSRANRMAHQLQAEVALQPNQLVALVLDKSEHMMVSILAVWKTGAAYVPIDPAFPDYRVRYMLEDTAARAIIADTTHLNRARGLASTGVPVYPSDLALLTGLWEECDPTSSSTPADLAYIMYTSGTTGRPKGVMVEHHGVVNLQVSLSRIFGLRATNNEVILSFSNYVFDHFVEQMTDALLNGQTLLMLDDDMRGDKERLYRYIEQNRVTYLSGTPSVVSMYEFGRFAAHLRRIDCVGEAFSEPVFDKIRSSFSGLIINGYGPTEVSITTHKRLYPYPARRTDKSIGRQLHNSTSYVLDEQKRRVPIGAVGELYLGGQGVARGYHNRPDLTRERFPANPFQTDEERRHGRNARLYRTGDLVRWIPGSSGEIEYLGRMDFQVKIRGQRIELGEIECVLSAYPGIRQSIALAHPRDGESENKLILVGYYVADAELPSNAIRRFMQSRLPDYMIPACLIAIGHVPVTASGKLDSKALPAVEKEEESDEIVPPRDEIERALREIWASLLKLQPETVSVSTDFFALGGDSLRSTKLSFLVGDRLGRQLPVSKLFQLRTIEAQARFLAHSSAYMEDLQPMGEPANQVCAVSPAQERLLFLHDLVPGAADAYNISLTVKLVGLWKKAAVENALNAIIARHEALRTVIAKSEGRRSYSQNVLGEEDARARFSMTCMTVATQLEADQEIAQCARYAFQLADELPFRACLLRTTTPQNLYLSFVVHHTAFDAWSWYLLQRDFYACAAASHGLSDAPALHSLRIQYKEYAQHHRAHLTDPRRQDLSGWWKARLEGLMPTELVTDRQRPPYFDYSGDDVNLMLDPETLQGVQQLARSCRASVYAVMLSVFALTLSTYTDQTDLSVGIPTTHRTHPEFESVIGFFVNLLPLRINTNQLSADALITHVMQSLVDTQLHQDLPFQELPRLLGLRHDASRHPVVQTVFNYEACQDLGSHSPILQMSEYTPKPDLVQSIAKFDLNVTVRETLEGLVVNFNYATTLFERQTVQRWLETYTHILQQMTQSRGLDLPIDELSLSPDALATPHIPLTVAITPDREDFETAIKMFEREVSRVPNLPAVVDGDRALSYQELDSQANQLARHIRSLTSPNPDDCVVLLLDKNMEMTIAILAVWKAGAAYVPLDPAGPPHRSNHIISESKPRLVIGQQGAMPSVECDCPIVALDSFTVQDALRRQSPDPVKSALGRNHLAYIIYTSGTTGQPKGVLVEHHGLTQLCTALRWRYFGDDPCTQHGILFLSHYTFDFSLEQIALSVLSGHKLLIPPEDFAVRSDFYHMASSQGLTYLSGTPSLLQQMDLSKFQGLRIVTAAGEQLLSTQYEKLRNMFGGPIYNAYGITESTVYNIISEFGPADAFQNSLRHVLPGTRAYVLDKHLRPLPVGAVGELYLAGDCLARGYLNQPELTAERFPANPFCNPYEKAAGHFTRLFKTGDLVRCRMSLGNPPHLEYLGRRDNQVKLRGFRIELRELDDVLRSCPGIRDAAIIPQFDSKSHHARVARALVAYFTAEPGHDIGESHIMAFLRDRVPGYMIPSHLHQLDGPLPVTVNGKLDTRQLPDVFSPKDAKSECSPPRDSLERKLCSIWADILGREECGIDDHFLRLGGDSISALQLVAQIYTQLGYPITVRQAFEMPTVRALRNSLSHSEDHGILPYRTEQGLVMGEAPLLPIQEWFLHKDLKNHNHWNHAFSIRTPVLDVVRLRAAVRDLQMYHDAFRTRLRFKGRLSTQHFVSTFEDVPLHVIDMDNSPRGYVSQLLGQWQSEFDLAHGPLADFAYLHSGAESTAHIWIAAHHAIIDTVSWQILTRDLETLYCGGTLGPKTSSVRQWANAMHQYQPSIDDRAYWNSVIAKAASPQFSPSTSRRLRQGLQITAEESAMLLHRLRASCDVHMDDMLLAAVGLAIQSCMPSQAPTMITLERHGREDDVDPTLDMSRTMGWFTSMFPFQIPHIDSNGLLASAAEVRRERNKVPHHGATYGAIYGYVQHCLPALSFNYLGQIGLGGASRDWNLELDYQDLPWGLCTSPADQGKSDSLLDITAVCLNGIIRVDLDGALQQEMITQIGLSIQDSLSKAASQLNDQHVPPPSRDRPFSNLPFTPYFKYRGDTRRGPTLFLFPPGEGGAESYFNNIIQSLPHRNIVAFNNLYLHNKARRTFEDLAELYERWIRELQPQGPYHFLGWSFGGVLALEVSRRLVSQGDRLALLSMLETYCDVRGAVQRIGLGEKQILDPIHHLYDPEPTRFSGVASTTDNLVLFKAMELNARYETEEEGRLYEYYDQTPANRLDVWVPRDRIQVVALEGDTHFSWVHNAAQVKLISGTVDRLMRY